MTEPRQTTILLADDDANFRKAVRLILMGEPYTLFEAGSLHQTWDLLNSEEPDLILLDVHFKGEGTSLDLLSRAKAAGITSPIIVLSGAATAGEAAHAVRSGAFDFLEKPVSEERLRLTIRRALEHSKLASVVKLLHENRTTDLLGQSSATVSIRKLVQQFAGRDMKVLITGETGVGKEIVATSLWKASTRAQKSFVILNAAAIPENLVESELFGHKKGAFTGALADQPGKIELADEGVLFLDEIGDLPWSVQNKLLRFLESGEIQKLGSAHSRRVDVRVFAATSRDLEQEVAKGRFRADLFYRLNVGRIHVPPLRDRTEDVATLFEFFIQSLCKKRNEATPFVAPEVIQLLQKYSWPGNVRELRNAAERCLAFATTIIDVNIAHVALPHLSSLKEEKTPDLQHDGNSFLQIPVEQEWISLKDFREKAEHLYIQQVLTSLGGNVSRTALVLGLERSYLHHKLGKLGIERTK
jgi:two-component system nitrogen regulation response regulator NtrX